MADFLSGLADMTGFGAGPSKRNTAAEEKAKRDALAALEGAMPAEYEKAKYLGGYEAEQVGDLPQLGKTELGGIATNPEYDRYRMEALRGLEEQAQDGMSAQDDADMARLEGDVNSANAGRVGAIQQNMAARGMGGSGAELVAQMAGSQAATQQQAQGAMDKAAMAQNNQRAARSQLGQMGSQMQAQDFGQRAQVGTAQDAINRFNTGNSVQGQFTNTAATNQAGQFNAGQAQGVEGNNAAQQETHNQNQFGNQARVSEVKFNDATAGINNARADYGAAKADQQSKQANTIKMASTAAMMFSDERAKTDVAGLSDADVDDFLNSIQPKSFKYKNPGHGDGQRVGVMAQDLENSKIGKALVKDGPEGKQLDINNVIGALLDSVAHLHRKTRG